MNKLLIFFLCSFHFVALKSQPRLVLPVGNTSAVTTAKFSPDGKKVITASSNGTIMLWEARTGVVLFTNAREADGYTQFSPDGSKILTLGTGCEIFETKTGNRIKSYSGEDYAYRIKIFYCGNFSADGKKIVTTSDNNNAEIWDVESERLLAILSGHTDNVGYAEFSPDGKKIVTASADNTARVWDSQKGELLFTLEGHQFDVICAKFSPDGQRIASISIDSIPRIWDANSGKLVATLVGHTYSMKDVAFSPDSKKIATASADGTAVIWEAESGKPLFRFEGHSDAINSICFSKNGQKLLTSSDDATALVWDVTTGNPIVNILGHGGAVNSAVFSPDERYILTASDDYTATIWSAGSGTLVIDLTGKSYIPTSAAFFAGNNKFITVFNDGIARVMDFYTGKPLFNLKGHTSGITTLTINPAGTKILTASWDSTAKTWDALSGKLLLTLKGSKGAVYSASFSRDGRKILTASADSTLRLWDAATGRLLAATKQRKEVFIAEFFPDGNFVLSFAGSVISAAMYDIRSGNFLEVKKNLLDSLPSNIIRKIKFSPDGKRMMIINKIGRTRILDLGTHELITCESTFDPLDASFSPDGKTVISTSVDNELAVQNASTGKRIYNSFYNEPDERHQDIVYSVQYSGDGTKVISTSRDNTVRIWDAGTGKLIYLYLVTGENNYLLKTADGYYFSTPPASKNLYYLTDDLRVVSFDQLDVKYNRPDIVLSATGTTDTLLITAYRKAWEKRIKKLGIDTTSFRKGYSVPEADFVGRDSIEFEQQNSTLKIHIKGWDSNYQLDRFNVWINEVPLYGQKGISLKAKNINEFDTTIIVKLSEGSNRLETSITNVNGTESYRMPLLLNYIPAVKQAVSTHFIGIGIDKFLNTKNNLRYSCKDIRDLAIALSEKYQGDIIVDTLFNENVNTANVKALKQKLLRTGVNDKVIISYSGHGLLSSDFDYYLSTYSMNFDKPEENGLPYDVLESLLDSIPSRKKLLLIDACHSGEVDKDELVRIDSIAGKAKLRRGLKPIAYKPGEVHLGLKNSFELMQSIFVNVSKSTGTTIISAAAGTQFALENSKLENGVFTFCILEALKNKKTMNVSDLKQTVSANVEKLTNGLQKPTSRNENMIVDWQLW